MSNSTLNTNIQKKEVYSTTLISNMISGSIPHKSIVIDLRNITKVFTKKRLELLGLISKIQPQSLTELVKATKRKKQAITRDLNILKRCELITLEKKGSKVIPKVHRPFLILSLENGSALQTFAAPLKN